MSSKKKNSGGGGVSRFIREAASQAKLEVENKAAHAASEHALLEGQFEIADEIVPFRPKIFNILDYIESSWGLNMKLYPVQRFLVKLYYFLPLDDQLKNIQVTDMLGSKVLYTFTEKEYLTFLFNEGRCNIGVQDHERRELVLAIGRRGGKCETEDNLVLTDNGIFRLGELGNKDGLEWQPLEITVAQEGGRRAKTSHFYNNGLSSTVVIATEAGFKKEGTANHRIKIMAPDGSIRWAGLGELKVGDYVAVHRGTNLWATAPVLLPECDSTWTVPGVVLDDAWGLFLGLMVGDGSWTHKHYVELTGIEEQVRFISNVSKECFGHPGRVFPAKDSKKGWRFRFDVTSTGVKRAGMGARKLLSLLGVDPEVSRFEKTIPWSILRSPRSVVCAFFRGLFETDGSAESGGRKITFSTASEILATEVQILLLNLGVVSTKTSRYKRKYNRHYWTITIVGVRSHEIFLRDIGFALPGKIDPSASYLRQDGKSNTDSIPHQLPWCKAWLEEIPKRNARSGTPGWGRSFLREALGNACKPGSGEGLNYARLRRALEVADQLGASGAATQHFKELLDLDYYFSKVKSIGSGSAKVYDLSVPEGAHFVSNGMVCHNSTLSGIFASYEIYKLLNLYNPQQYYGLPNGNRIQIISIAADKEQAGILFNEVTSHLAKCDYFKPHIANNTLTHIQFRTPYDIEKFGPTARHQNGKFTSFNGKATLRVTFKGSVSRSLRGPGNVVVIMDEMAHYQEKNSKISKDVAKDVYDAVTPSTAAFSPKDPETGMPLKKRSGATYPVESRIIAISSPLNRTGKFYELFQQAMSGGVASQNMLAIQAPTWEINPTLPATYYIQKYHSDPVVFITEHGAQFSDRVRGWIEREADLMACVDQDYRPQTIGIPRYPHEMGIDVGLVNDGTAVFITSDVGGKVGLVYHELWQAGVDWRKSNPHLGANDYSTEYCKTLGDVNRLEFDEIGEWIYKLTKRFYITGGIFDRWNGIPLEQFLLKKGLTQFKSEYFTADLRSRIYQNAKMLMFDKGLIMYDHPKQATGDSIKKHSPFVQELLTLEARTKSKNIVEVAAPHGEGYHDDMSDAYTRAVWLTSERLRNHKHVYGALPGVRLSDSGAMTAQRYQMMRARTHGMHSDRNPAARHRMVRPRSPRGVR